MEVAEVPAPGRNKVPGSLLRKTKQICIPRHIICLLCMCQDDVIFHGVREGESLVIASVEHVVCTCSG